VMYECFLKSFFRNTSLPAYDASLPSSHATQAPLVRTDCTHINDWAQNDIEWAAGLKTSDTTVKGHCGSIHYDQTWAAADKNLLDCQVVVPSGRTLTIEAGATIYANKGSWNGMQFCPTAAKADCTAANECVDLSAGDDFVGTYSAARDCVAEAPTLIVAPGGTIMAAGTAAAPITFTANLPSNELDCTAGGLSCATVTDTTTGMVTSHGKRGNWGGLVLLGNAFVKGGSANIEGVAGVSYGGSDDSDSSGTLQYVRVWYGGSKIGPDNEINGITFGGVGSGTTVDHCEVALNLDDGFEFFGGSVNAKYLSTLFVGDDAFDTDKGYTGSMQFIYAMLGVQGDRGSEMDGNNGDATKSAPSVMGATFVGSVNNRKTVDAGSDAALMRLREGTGGAFANMVLARSANKVTVRHQCHPDDGVAVTQTRAAGQQALYNDKRLYISATNIFHETAQDFLDCGDDLTMSTDAGSPVMDAQACPIGQYKSSVSQPCRTVQTGSSTCLGDMTFDNDIDVEDILIVLSRFGDQC